MAINYTEVGWDTSKYVNPTNMNQMDDGIKAACDGVDAINAGTITGGTIALTSDLPTVTKLNQNIEFSSTDFSCEEYFRYSQYGQLVIIDFGGIKSSTTATGVMLANIPSPITRTVTALFYDQAARDPVMLVYTAGTTLNAQIFQANVRCYGQMIYLTY